jgi:hypothetical protein
VRELKHALSANALALMPDFEKRVQVLQVLNYVDGNRTVQLKGRVAREINTSDELILTELLCSATYLPICRPPRRWRCCRALCSRRRSMRRRGSPAA